MSSIRPLITITILAVVGAYLYVKINEGPPVRSAATDAWQSQTPEGVPPLGSVSASTASESAPAWPSAPTEPAPPVAPPTTSAPPAESAASIDLPPVPEVPPLPDPPPTTTATASAPTPPPVELPANIPAARYPDDSTPSEHTAAADSAMAAVGLASQPSAPADPPIQPETPSPQPPAVQPEADRYAAASTDDADPNSYLPQAPQQPASEPPAAPTQSALATQWPVIQASLERGDLAQAHQLLSAWYGDESLSSDEERKVVTLLSQLAGTVVYSTEHRLEPPYVVRPGDTLETIAQQYNVPWQLLAKINGVPASSAVQPGQELKVVRGPFEAVVDVNRGELVLSLGGRYAGKFPVTVPSVSALGEGEWLVDEKLADSPSSVTQSAYAPAPVAADRAIVLRSETASGGSASTVAIASGSISAKSSATGTPVIEVSPQDAGELTDILSVGSRVVIRR